MRRNRKTRPQLLAGGRVRYGVHDDDAPVSGVFGGGVGVVSLRGGFLHGGWGVFEGEEGGHAVGFEEGGEG